MKLRPIYLLLFCMVLLKCECDDNLGGSETPPDELKMSINFAAVQEILITQMGCFLGDFSSLLGLETEFDIEFRVTYLDTDMVAQEQIFLDTATIQRRYTKNGGNITENREFVIPYLSTTGMMITGTLVFSECHCCCVGTSEIHCEDSECNGNTNICTNAGKPTFELEGSNAPVQADGKTIYYDIVTLKPKLEPCSECGCETTLTDEC